MAGSEPTLFLFQPAAGESCEEYVARALTHMALSLRSGETKLHPTDGMFEYIVQDGRVTQFKANLRISNLKVVFRSTKG